MSSVEPMTHTCFKQLVTLSPKVFFYRISTYVTRLRFRYVTPWILARDFTRKITTSVKRLYPKSAVLRTDDVIGCRNVTT